LPGPSLALIAIPLGVVLGLGAGLFLLIMVDRFDDRPGSFNDLHDLFDEQVMGQIPFESSLLKSSKQIALLRDGDDRHMFLEAYRNLRSSLLYMATQGKRPKVLVVTSAIPGDGKSLTTANLAITMALAGARVLLIDADLRKGALHRNFGVEPSPGLSDTLNGKLPVAKTILPTSMPNLFLIPRGETLHNPGELFVKPTTHSLIAELATQFDYVIFDTAPVMAADDVTSLSPHVEGVLFVIRANYTSGRVARAALDLLYQREINVLGLVFNGVQTRSNEYYYYRYKDYYAKSA
jgi:capsular exopolysaccharide synthesis family protein